MKTFKIGIFFPVLCLLVSSCYSPKLLVDDDVYVLKSNELPIGESLTDETSFASFKNNQNAGMVSSNYYNNPNDLSYYPLCRNASMYFIGCGCSFYVYSHFYGNRPFNPFGYSSMFYNPYSPFGYDPFYSPMGFYNPYGYNPYYGYGYGNYGNTSYNPGIVTTNYNHHSGPRGTYAGIGNPSGRPQMNSLKSNFSSNTPNKPIHQESFSNRKIDPSIVVGQNNRPVKPSFVQSAGRTVENKPIKYSSVTERGVRSNMSNQPVIDNSGRSTGLGRGSNLNGHEPNGGRINSGGSGGSHSTPSGGSSGGGRAGGGSSSGGARRN